MQETTFVEVKLSRAMKSAVWDVVNFDPSQLAPVRNEPDVMLTQVDCTYDVDKRRIINIKREYAGVKHDVYVCWSKELEQLIGWPLEEMEKIRQQAEVTRYNLSQCENKVVALTDKNSELRENVLIANRKIINARHTNGWKIFFKLITGRFDTLFD